MPTANLKNIYGGGGSSLALKAGQSFSTTLNMGIGGVNTGPLNVSSPTNVIRLTGRWAVTLINLACANPATGTMTATLTVDGVNVLSGASVGTAANINLWGQGTNASATTSSPPVIICNTSLTLSIQRSTADTVETRCIALAID